MLNLSADCNGGGGGGGGSHLFSGRLESFIGDLSAVDGDGGGREWEDT